MDIIILLGGLEFKLVVFKVVGFLQLMLWFKDLVGYFGGLEVVVKLVCESGVCVIGIQVMCDYEGLQGSLYDYKVDVVCNLLQICKVVGVLLLMVCFLIL